jgi:MFS family permease
LQTKVENAGKRFQVVAALGAAQTLAWGSTYYLPAILAAPMARETGTPVSYVFAAFSAALVVSALLGPVAGRAIDRRGGRNILVCSNLLFAAGLVALAIAHGPVLLAVGWLIIGVGMALGLYDAAFSTLAGLYGRDARGAITGITLIAGFASTVAWPISGLLDAEVGWRGACLVWAGLHLVAGVPLNLCLPRSTALASVPVTADSNTASGERPRFAMALLAFVFAVTWFVTGAMAAHLPRLLEVTGSTPAAAIAAAALVGPAQVAARLLEFSLLRRFHPIVSARLATLGHPAGAALLIAFGTPAAPFFTLLHGGGTGVLTIATGSLPLAIFGPGGYGLRQGLIGAPARFVQAGAPFIFGMMMDVYGAKAVWLSTALSLAALAALLALHAERENETA